MQIPHPVNFRFADFPGICLTCVAPWAARLSLEGESEPFDDRLVLRAPEEQEAVDFSFRLDSAQSLTIENLRGQSLLQSSPRGWLGRSGKAWLVRWHCAPETRFYGLGGKSGFLERTGMRTACWNVDVWGVHPLNAVRLGPVDPVYTNIPWVISENSAGAVGFFVRHPGRVFFSLCADARLHPSQESPEEDVEFYFGAEEGFPEIYVVVGADLTEVARRFSRLLSATPCPPLWALGHQQSRWGYGSAADLRRLDQLFDTWDIPCDGLWLDIDYMDGYRVFTLSAENRRELAETLSVLREKGRHCVAILDPGVKDEPGYPVRDEGVRRDVFCRNDHGNWFRGFVWPGKTLFPDFSRADVRSWWADQVAEFAARVGFSGFWLDMNDPATGGVDPRSMRFGDGREHWTWHNLYANGMAEATWQGLRRADPDRRPLVISRSGWAGINAWSGLWMGDNFSNWTHLRMSLPMGLNLVLSGVAFVGADIPGFGDDADAELAERWYQAHILFPLMRNHCVKNARAQEPWAFGEQTAARLRRVIVERYRLLPYLYQCFRAHERYGDLVLAPMRSPDGHWLDDQYQVGRHVFVAPILESGITQRRVCFPLGNWYHADTQTWFSGPAEEIVSLPADVIPVFFREGAAIPTAPGNPRMTRQINLGALEYVVYLRGATRLEQIDPDCRQGWWEWDSGDGPTDALHRVVWCFRQSADGLKIEAQCPSASSFTLVVD